MNGFLSELLANEFLKDLKTVPTRKSISHFCWKWNDNQLSSDIFSPTVVPHIFYELSNQSMLQQSHAIE